MGPLAAPIRGNTRALALVLALALLPSALAQVPEPTLSVTLAQPSLEIGAANTSTLTGTVTYGDTAPSVGGTNDAVITLTVTPPAGWNVTIEPDSQFILSPGASAEFTLTLVAPALDPGAADTVGDLVVDASSQGPGGRSAEASATVGLTALAPPAPPVIPWYQTPGGIAAIVGAILLVIGLVALLVVRRKRRIAAEKAAAEAAAHAAYLARETGIGIALTGAPLQYGHKREVVFRVAVTNRSERPRVAVIDIAEATNGWRAALQVSKIPLTPGQTQQVTLVVTPDSVITPGDRASVVVRAKPEEARELSEKVTVDVLAPKHAAPGDPHYRIVTVHREGANQGVRR